MNRLLNKLVIKNPMGFPFEFYGVSSPISSNGVCHDIINLPMRYKRMKRMLIIDGVLFKSAESSCFHSIPAAIILSALIYLTHYFVGIFYILNITQSS